jgi:hypothetical protein
VATGLVVVVAFALGWLKSSPGHSDSTSPTATSSLASVRVDGANAGIQLASVGAPPTAYTTSAAPAVELTPAGPLPGPATVHFRLATPVPADQGVVIATSETGAGDWSYLPATLDASRQEATITVTHFSFFSPLRVLVNDLFSAFKSQFMEAFSGGLLKDISPPSCTGDPGTNGYGAVSVKSSTIKWCLGYEGGRNILRVTNLARYPLELAHPSLDVIDQASLLATWSKLSTVSRWASGPLTILGAGDSATFGGSLQPGGTTVVQSELDGLGLALSTLQVGVDTALLFLGSPAAKSVPDAQTVKTGMTAMKAMSSSVKCSGALSTFVDSANSGKDPNVGSLLVDCFESALEVAPVLGLVLVTSATGGLIAFFAGSATAIHDLLTNADKVTITVKRLAAVTKPTTVSIPPASVTIVPSLSPGSVVNFEIDHGVTVATTGQVAALTWLPVDLRGFLSSELTRLKAENGNTTRITITAYRVADFLEGSVSTIPPDDVGGSQVLWGKSSSGRWQFIIGGQGPPECAQIRQAGWKSSIPEAFLGSMCNDVNGNFVPYKP